MADSQCSRPIGHSGSIVRGNNQFTDRFHKNVNKTTKAMSLDVAGC
jgi:hypothetical protein